MDEGGDFLWMSYAPMRNDDDDYTAYLFENCKSHNAIVANILSTSKVFEKIHLTKSSDKFKKTDSWL